LGVGWLGMKREPPWVLHSQSAPACAVCRYAGAAWTRLCVGVPMYRCLPYRHTPTSTNRNPRITTTWWTAGQTEAWRVCLHTAWCYCAAFCLSWVCSWVPALMCQPFGPVRPAGGRQEAGRSGRAVLPLQHCFVAFNLCRCIVSVQRGQPRQGLLPAAGYKLTQASAPTDKLRQVVRPEEEQQQPTWQACMHNGGGGGGRTAGCAQVGSPTGCPGLGSRPDPSAGTALIKVLRLTAQVWF